MVPPAGRVVGGGITIISALIRRRRLPAMLGMGLDEILVCIAGFLFVELARDARYDACIALDVVNKRMRE